jgi:hypothetical protein
MVLMQLVEISRFDQGHRVLSNSSVKFKWSDNMKTTIDFSTKELKDHRLWFIMIEETCCNTISSIDFRTSNRADINSFKFKFYS